MDCYRFFNMKYWHLLLLAIALVLLAGGAAAQEELVDPLAADEENETQAQVSVYAENNFINTAKNFVNRVRSIAPTFQDVINRARQIGNLARSVPVVGDFVGAHIAMANMLKQMIKVGVRFIKQGKPSNDFLSNVAANFHKLIVRYRNDATLKCLYYHIKQKENMVVAFTFPFGASVECMGEWSCFTCVDMALRNKQRLMIDMVTLLLSSLTESELEGVDKRLRSFSEESLSGEHEEHEEDVVGLFSQVDEDDDAAVDDYLNESNDEEDEETDVLPQGAEGDRKSVV